MPTLNWSGEPAATKQFAVIVFDPDAPGGDFTHWTVYGIAPTTHTIGSGMPVGVSEGLNDFGKAGWSGPCPPHGQKHRYAFLVRALNTADAPPAVSRRAAVESAEESHIIGRAEMVATYTRP
jgi:Raf kinase inhibitor-like YbhB/YbcL family protein